MRRRLELDLADDVNAGRRRDVENDAEVFVVGLPFGRRDVEAGRLQDDRVVDVADEGVGQVGQLLAAVPLMKEKS